MLGTMRLRGSGSEIVGRVGDGEWKGGDGDGGESKGERGMGEVGGANGGGDEGVDSNDGMDEACPICYCEKPQFGISTECAHFFCGTCVTQHLLHSLNQGKFPVYCPVCQQNAPKGEEPHYGRIGGKAMTFLERHGLVDKEFQFRFMALQDSDSKKPCFKCPAKCGRFLIDEQPRYNLRRPAKEGKVDGGGAGGAAQTLKPKIEQCPCGAHVCVKCHQSVMERARDSFQQQETKSQAVGGRGGAAVEGDGGVDWDELLEDHTCPDAGDDAENDAMAREAMGGAGKKCPNPDCDMFIIKNDGCDVMMCGERAHGLLSRAIKNVRLTVLR